MNAITSCEQRPTKLHQLESVTISRLNRAALASGIADRRVRLQEIETAMDQACEAAVRRISPNDRTGTRLGWSRHAWAIYTAEAVTQARYHGTALARLRREVEHLQHIDRCVS